MTGPTSEPIEPEAFPSNWHADCYICRRDRAQLYFTFFERIRKMTVNQQVIEGSWKQVKGKVRERWGQLTDNELEEARGSIEHLVGLIQQKTGEVRSEVESYLQAAATDGASMVSKATEAVVNQAQQVAETAQHAAERTAESVRAGYVKRSVLSGIVRSNRWQYVLERGLITGVIIGLLTRSR